MMTDVRNGEINLVLVHDLSRFGRNYIETGKYLEDILPSLGCRLVAPADGIDTESGENDMIPFLNAFNDYYLKCISDKIKLSFQAKAKNGHKLTGTAPYGYVRDATDHTKLAVDEYAAEIIRKIYSLRAEGYGYTRIVSVLNREGITPPRLYYYQRQNRKPSATASPLWHIHAISKILRDEHYLGMTV
jgi:DNA invertase Pin-like site-specific DNA recombinase